MDDPDFTTNSKTALLDKDRVALWQSVTDTFRKLPRSQRETYRLQYRLNLQLVKLLDDAGVQMMTGTDDGGWEVPGFVLHQEFDALAAAGLSPLRILQMTTLRPAQFLGRKNRILDFRQFPQRTSLIEFSVFTPKGAVSNLSTVARQTHKSL
jgi:imidazolonepropionase-like amidohydrolase